MVHPADLESPPRRTHAEYLTPGTQWRFLFGALLLLYACFMTGAHPLWVAGLGVLAVLSLAFWYLALQRLRAITSLPRSTIGGAAQGYIEVQGRGHAYSGPPLISKLTGLPCLWYRYRIEERQGRNEWRVIDSGESTRPFLLEDGSGLCVVDPDGAEIQTSHVENRYDADFRQTEWTLIANDRIRVTGLFTTRGGSSADHTLNDETRAVLAEWKQDMAGLRRRFDLDDNGTLDDREWTLARQAAMREAQRRLTAARAAPDVNRLVRPQDGRMFSITNLDKDKQARWYLALAWVHVLVFFAALLGVAWLVSRHA